MSSQPQYIVVVEIDNKRALAAYQKGQRELAGLMPELMEHAKRFDKWKQERNEREEAENMRKYGRKHEGLISWTSRPDQGYQTTLVQMKLDDECKLAGVAMSPYRVEERRALEMISWEDGTRIESLKQGMSSREQSMKLG